MNSDALKKYQRTPHLQWSPGVQSDDIRIINLNNFIGKRVLVGEKMDGENTTLYSNYIHARSIDSRNHVSRNWVKRWHQTFAHEIPDLWRICGENLYAEHSIAYKNLQSYFYGFSIWNDENKCLSWDKTREWFELLDIPYPRIIYDGIWDEALIREISVDTEIIEGYVVRLADSFTYEDFNRSIAKWVRKGHVQTNKHWAHQQIKINGLEK